MSSQNQVPALEMERRQLAIQDAMSERLLNDILPKHIVSQLQAQQRARVADTIKNMQISAKRNGPRATAGGRGRQRSRHGSLMLHATNDPKSAASGRESSKFGSISPNISAMRKSQKLFSNPIVDERSRATVLFADIVSFTKRCAKMTPGEVLKMLNELFYYFDEAANQCGVYKVETIGDAVSP